jgi:DNA polymerase elongation subunit (family B)
MDPQFRLYDFNILNQDRRYKTSSDSTDESDDVEQSENNDKKDRNEFVIQMFGINEEGKTCSILVENFNPFFYLKVDERWTQYTKQCFLQFIKKKIGSYYESSIMDCKLIKRKKLYGFDAGKEHKFIMLKFKNVPVFNKVKNIWYSRDRKLLPNGIKYAETDVLLYEGHIPPLLRFFHLNEISPSGWISLPRKKVIHVKENKKTTCDFEYIINQKYIVAINDKEVRVPYKICSFDIEASSSHGDFPVPIKSYKKLATNIIDFFEKTETPNYEDDIRYIILIAFGYTVSLVKYDNLVDKVYPKELPTETELDYLISETLSKKLDDKEVLNAKLDQLSIESAFENMVHHEEEESEYPSYSSQSGKKTKIVNKTIIDLLKEKTVSRESKLNELNRLLTSIFPVLEGDKVTFIGSTFMKYGEPEPYLNHCIVLNTCGDVAVDNNEIETYNTEEEVLLAWSKIIQRENPDIVIGYNIFGFDYWFMFNRAEETGCLKDFLKLSKNVDEVCGKDPYSSELKLEETSIALASGQYDLKYIKMNGRIQIDLYNYFRREENLTSYKLDYVAGHFIGDYVKKLYHDEYGVTTTIHTNNLTGLLCGSYIHFEEIGHTTDYYSDGAKFSVVSIDKSTSSFTISGIALPDDSKKIRWCLAKDDVTPKDIFRMTNGSKEDRAIIAKYCIQDCNLVHYLMNKVDVMTGYVEMAKICSVPISFLILRGQGIKLTSYVAKKCREKRTLMPTIEKSEDNDGYEGAIVLDPKCDLYLDNPVACVDYASLYPSSMLSENLSHDSKVWTKEYDLNNELIRETGEKDEDGNFIYDGLDEYEYVDITYDTFKYVRKSPSAAAEKIKSGYKICRFAQFPLGSRAIMPSILEELLLARKTTRKQIALQSDEFMKNVLDKRQLGYKVTANSLYGQCGAKTSTFYDKDIAASTTATGRLLLTYAKRLIEETYGDLICETQNYGRVRTKAEYIYGDTDSVFFTFNLETLEGEPIRGKKALEITIELAQEAGHLASRFLKNPHDLEYEKTFMPFCLLSKKRYVGMLYEHDPEKGKRKEMGIVLKRRDNAPIVKDIYGGIIDILMKEKDIKKATSFLKSCLTNMVEEKYPIDKLIISKSLRSGYKNPQQIAHKVLADRITARDPGNKPSSGDRIPFVYVHNPNKKALQGDKIETPTFIKETGMKIDYSFYITNQIMKPVQQLFALVLEKIWEMTNKRNKLKKFKSDVAILLKNEKELDPIKLQDKLESMRNKEVKQLLFDEFLREANNSKEGNQSLPKIFQIKEI